MIFLYRKLFPVLIEIFIIFLFAIPILGEHIPNVDRVVVNKKKRVLQYGTPIDIHP